MYQALITEQYYRGYFSYNKYLKLPENIRMEIENATTFLPDKVNFNERIYCYIHDIIEHPICLRCGDVVKFPHWLEKKKRHYRKYCSNKCSNNCSLVQEKKKTAYFEKYGVDNPSKHDGIKKQKNESLMRNFNGCCFNPQSTLHQNYKKTLRKRYNTDVLLEIEGYREKFQAMMSRRSHGSSKAANKFIQNFIESHNIDPERCMYGKKEFFLLHKKNKNNALYFYDLVVFKSVQALREKNIHEIQLILEYDGLYWHPSIDQVISNSTLIFRGRNLTLRDMYRKDRHKELVARTICKNFIRIRPEKIRHLP